MTKLWTVLSLAGIVAVTVTSRADEKRADAQGSGAPSEGFNTGSRWLEEKLQNHGRVWFKFQGRPAVSVDSVEPRQTCTVQTHYLVRVQGPVAPVPVEATCQVPLGKTQLSTIKVQPYCRDRKCSSAGHAASVEWKSTEKLPCTIDDGDHMSTWIDASEFSLRFNSAQVARRATEVIRALALECGAREEKKAR